MKHQRIHTGLAALALAVVFSSCSSLRLEPADFGWPVESELTVGPANTVEDVRYGVTFNVAALAAEEFADTAALRGATIRLLRGTDGYYYLTGPRFEHVYVFAAGDGALSLKTKVRVVPETPDGLRKGLNDPALNQRPPHVELIDGPGVRILITADGLADAPGSGGNKP